MIVFTEKKIIKISLCNFIRTFFHNFLTENNFQTTVNDVKMRENNAEITEYESQRATNNEQVTENSEQVNDRKDAQMT